MPPTTPNAISPLIRFFCAKIVPDSPPFFVPVCPAADALAGRSFENVAQVVARLGGEAQHGWAIWECADFLIAEFHTIWFGTFGPLNITPSPDNEARILFLPDPTAKVSRKAIPSRFMPLTVEGRLSVLEWFCAGERIVLFAPPPSLWERLIDLTQFRKR